MIFRLDIGTVQTVYITIKVVSYSFPACGEVYSIKLHLSATCGRSLDFFRYSSFNNYDLKVDTLYYMVSLNIFLHLTAWYTSFNNYDLKVDRLYYMVSLNFFLHLTAWYTSFNNYHLKVDRLYYILINY